MLIRDQVRQGSWIVFGLVIAAVAITGVVISQIRFGGPMQQDNALQDVLLADVLPPPAYSVEPYLLVSLIAARPQDAGTHLERLNALRTEFRQREAFWKATELPPAIRREMLATLADADRFWDALDSEFLPALRAGNTARVTQQNAAMVEQSSAAARSLAHEADALALLVDAFCTREADPRPADERIGQGQLRESLAASAQSFSQTARAA
jgi:hypothetical protein